MSLHKFVQSRLTSEYHRWFLVVVASPGLSNSFAQNNVLPSLSGYDLLLSHLQVQAELSADIHIASTSTSEIWRRARDLAPIQRPACLLVFESQRLQVFQLLERDHPSCSRQSTASKIPHVRLEGANTDVVHTISDLYYLIKGDSSGFLDKREVGLDLIDSLGEERQSLSVELPCCCSMAESGQFVCDQTYPLPRLN